MEQEQELSEGAKEGLSKWAKWVRIAAIPSTLLWIGLWAIYLTPVIIISVDGVSSGRINDEELAIFIVFSILGLGALGCASMAIIKLWQASMALRQAHLSSERMEAGLQSMGSFWMWILYTVVGGFVMLLMLFFMIVGGFG